MESFPVACSLIWKLGPWQSSQNVSLSRDTQVLPSQWRQLELPKICTRLNISKYRALTCRQSFDLEGSWIMSHNKWKNSIWTVPLEGHKWGLRGDTVIGAVFCTTSWGWDAGAAKMATWIVPVWPRWAQGFGKFDGLILKFHWWKYVLMCSCTVVIIICTCRTVDVSQQDFSFLGHRNPCSAKHV